MPRTLFWRPLLLTLAVGGFGVASAIVPADAPAAEQVQADSDEGNEAEEEEQEVEQADEPAAKPDEKDAAAPQESEDAKADEDKDKTDEAKDADSKGDDDKEDDANDDDDKKADDKKADEKEPKKRKTYTVEPKPLKIEVSVSGTIASEVMNEIELDAEAWSSFEIEEIVPHGARVNAGEVLVRFDPKDLEEAITELELSQRLSELSLLKMEQDLPRVEEELKRRLDEAERAWDEEKEDYQRYTDKERELVKESQEMRLKQSKFSLDYAQDELDQLEKMYLADDLTEETEELILRRSRTELEFANFSYEIAKYNHDVVMNASLPRQDEQLKLLHRRVELALERVKATTDLDINRARYELDQARNARRKSLERHSDLTADKRLLTIKAPAAGLVYYGKCVGGKWNEIASMKQKLVVDKSVPRDTVIMTIVDPEKLCVLASINEKDLPSVAAGEPAELTLTAEGVDPIAAKVDSVDRVPVSAGKFDISIEVTGQAPDWLLPGMTGKATIVTYEKKDALLVPTDAVHTDDDEDADSDEQYVWLVDGDKVDKRTVETGKTKGKEVEITSGLEKGDVVSLEPEEKADEDADGKAADDSGDDDEDDDSDSDD